MSLSVALTHRTSYQYDRLVELGPQVIRLRPAPHTRTPVLSYNLSIEPPGHFINWLQDPHSNYLARVQFLDKVAHLDIRVELVIEWAVQNPFDFYLEPTAESYPFHYEPETAQALKPYLEPATPRSSPLLSAWIDAMLAEDRAGNEDTTVDFLVRLNQRLANDIEYLVRMEPGVQTPEETLSLRRGSCRDSGWLLVEILRRLGLAARFVSGYLIQLVADVKPLDGPEGVDADFTDLHAWAEVYLPGAGWVGLDPTSGLLAGEGHIPLAATPEPSTAAPITGMAGKAEVEFDFDMSVRRIHETPRVTKPFSDAQWAAIDRLGDKVDADLKTQDVRLTMGGEPTFVAMDDAEADEWNTQAVGHRKRHYAEALIRHLQRRFAPNGLLHYGQGKWYPGEPLPRWSFSLYWRRDQEPVWQNSALIAPERSEDTGEGPKPEDARQLLTKVAESLGLAAHFVQPVYEDPWHFIDRELQLPDNVDPFDAKLDDPLERARLARVFKQGLGQPSGFVLPVQRWQSRDGGGWLSEVWRVRSEQLLLTPGDSPAGFRLPLQSLPYVDPAAFPYHFPRDPFAPAPPLPEATAWQRQFRRHPDPTSVTDGAANQQTPQQLTAGTSPDGTRAVRTALTIEPRDGRLCVFMPPTESADDYLALVAAVEQSTAALGLSIHLEGYEPPPDHRLNVIKVTPDPGVIEVNVQPARSWRELVEITQGLDSDARKVSLGTEKFMVDGRHTGTGGGNHLVLGGARAEESPFLRRPDLLKSLLLYWQNHPALSFFFSGLFIGPTSQAPRIDEARMDSLYELAIAFQQVPGPGQPAPQPWLVDRIFRHLLTDVTGNTHRSEICIDKLYSPDGPTGRLGLVEFRAFEMPPHWRMNLLQQLLLRALVAWFWRTPYTGELVHWGTDLHDRFMLRQFIWEDIADIVRDLKQAGFAFEQDWFQPQLEFRFPRIGTITYRSMTLTLHQALEPWHVLGEEGSATGTARYVDSSLERIQVSVSNFNPSRYQVLCNGHPVPMAPTGEAGMFVAAVRYRAWPLASALHPTIAPHVPLAFDLYDTWSAATVAGCTYDVMHPGGRNTDDIPVNAYAAESRRRSRFSAVGQRNRSPAREPAPITQDFPMTLDLRLL